MRISAAAPGPWRQLAPPLLVGLVAYTLGWDLWAVVLDHRYSGSDTFVGDLLHLVQLVSQGRIGDYFAAANPKGPVPALLALPLVYLVGDGLIAARVLSVIAHGVLILQVFLLARRGSGRGAAGLWAALLCAASPLIFGWCRLAFQEPVLTVFVLGSLQLMMCRHLDRAWPWLLLGLVLALGVMVKLALPIFVIGPGLYLAAAHLRARRGRGAVHLGLALATFLLLALPWLLHNLEDIRSNLAASSHRELSVLGRAAGYLSLSGVSPLLLMALAALVVLWRRGPRHDRDALAILGSCLLLSLALFIGKFDLWSRYIVPSLAVAAVLAGMGLEWAVRHALQRRARALFAGATAVLLLGQLAWVTTHGLPRREVRELGTGMIRPDHRPHLGFPQAIAALSGMPGPALLIHNSVRAINRTEGLEAVWSYRGWRHRLLGPGELAADGCQEGRPLAVLLINGTQTGLKAALDERHWPIPPHDEGLVKERETLRWLSRQQAIERLGRFSDPDGLTYEILLVRCSPPFPRNKTAPER